MGKGWTDNWPDDGSTYTFLGRIQEIPYHILLGDTYDEYNVNTFVNHYRYLSRQADELTDGAIPSLHADCISERWTKRSRRALKKAIPNIRFNPQCTIVDQVCTLTETGNVIHIEKDNQCEIWFLMSPTYANGHKLAVRGYTLDISLYQKGLLDALLVTREMIYTT